MNKDILEYQVKKAKAETSKLELKFKIECKKEDIKRLEEHIALQDKEIEKADKRLNELIK